MIHTHIIPVLKDNYAYVLKADNGDTAVLDPGEAAPVIDFCTKNDMRPDEIFLTHHHADHIGGASEIKQKFGSHIYAPAADAHRIQAGTYLDETTPLSFGGEDVHILETPGHTLGHICYYFPQSKILFSGDTLFLMGCGRLFEGSPAQMWQSLSKIISLPDDTRVYCGHEYALSCGAFCMTIEPENAKLQSRMDALTKIRAQNIPSVPALLSEEKETNVFLRAGSAERFAEVREKMNSFKG